jgi:hypothetical protein
MKHLRFRPPREKSLNYSLCQRSTEFVPLNRGVPLKLFGGSEMFPTRIHKHLGRFFACNSFHIEMLAVPFSLRLPAKTFKIGC